MAEEVKILGTTPLGGIIISVNGGPPQTVPPTAPILTGKTEPLPSEQYHTIAPAPSGTTGGFAGIIYSTEQPQFAGQEAGQVYVSPEVPKEQIPEMQKQVIETQLAAEQRTPEQVMALAQQVGAQKKTILTSQPIINVTGDIFGIPSKEVEISKSYAGGDMWKVQYRQPSGEIVTRQIYQPREKGFFEYALEDISKTFAPKVELTIITAPLIGAYGAAIAPLTLPVKAYSFGSEMGEIKGIIPKLEFIGTTALATGAAIVTSFKEKPVESAIMLGVSTAITSGLINEFKDFGKGVLPQPTVKGAGAFEIRLEPPEGELVRGNVKGMMGTIKPETATKLEGVKIVSKNLGTASVEIQMPSTMDVLYRKEWLSGTFGAKVFQKVSYDVAGISITPVEPILGTENLFISKTIFGGKELFKGVTFTQKLTTETTTGIETFKGLSLYVPVEKGTKYVLVSATKVIPTIEPILGAGEVSGFLVETLKPSTIVKTDLIGKVGIELGKVFLEKVATKSVQEIIPFQAQVVAGGISLLSMPKKEVVTAELTKQMIKPIVSQKVKITPIGTQMTRQLVMTKQIITPIETHTQLLKEITLETQITKPLTKITTVMPPPPVITPGPPTPIPIFGGFPEGGFRGHRMFRPFKVGKMKTKYRPSLGGVLLGRVVRKTPKGLFTGMEIRPMVSKSLSPSSGRKSRGFSLPKLRGFKMARKGKKRR